MNITSSQKSLARERFKELKSRYGKGWQYLSEDQQQNAIKAEAFSLVAAIDSDTCSHVHSTVLAMLQLIEIEVS